MGDPEEEIGEYIKITNYNKNTAEWLLDQNAAPKDTGTRMDITVASPTMPNPTFNEGVLLSFAVYYDDPD